MDTGSCFCLSERSRGEGKDMHAMYEKFFDSWVPLMEAVLLLLKLPKGWGLEISLDPVGKRAQGYIVFRVWRAGTVGGRSFEAQTSAYINEKGMFLKIATGGEPHYVDHIAVAQYARDRLKPQLKRKLPRKKISPK